MGDAFFQAWGFDLFCGLLFSSMENWCSMGPVFRSKKVRKTLSAATPEICWGMGSLYLPAGASFDQHLGHGKYEDVEDWLQSTGKVRQLSDLARCSQQFQQRL